MWMSLYNCVCKCVVVTLFKGTNGREKIFSGGIVPYDRAHGVLAQLIWAVQKCIGCSGSKHSLSSYLSTPSLYFLFPNLSRRKYFCTARMGRTGAIWYPLATEKFLNGRSSVGPKLSQDWPHAGQEPAVKENCSVKEKQTCLKEKQLFGKFFSFSFLKNKK